MKVFKIALIVVLAVSLLPVVPVLSLRWYDPPTSAFMLQDRLAAWWHKQRAYRPDYRWVNWYRISPHAPLAVVAAEDQKFPHHWGFDREALAEAWEEHRDGIRTRGASTITQQVAKNLFLWPGKNLFRKGLEAYFTVLIELCWSKKRILEVYLNIAEFGRGVYGIGAASARYFNKLPRYLNRWESALLATVLPNPKRMRVDRPSTYMQARAVWILSEMDRLNRIDRTPYLQDL
jgi:monofunctional biosynthetic peptidoglycan transglycosylase